jgi:hypothetical protein
MPRILVYNTLVRKTTGSLTPMSYRVQGTGIVTRELGRLNTCMLHFASCNGVF